MEPFAQDYRLTGRHFKKCRFVHKWIQEGELIKGKIEWTDYPQKKLLLWRVKGIGIAGGFITYYGWNKYYSVYLRCATYIERNECFRILETDDT